MVKLNQFLQTELQKSTKSSKVKETAQAYADYLAHKNSHRLIASELFAGSEHYHMLNANNELIEGGRLYVDSMLNYYETFSPTSEEMIHIKKLSEAFVSLDNSTKENALKNIETLLQSIKDWVRYQPKKDNEAALKTALAIDTLAQSVIAYIADNPIKTSPIHFIIPKQELLKKISAMQWDIAQEIDALNQKITHDKKNTAPLIMQKMAEAMTFILQGHQHDQDLLATLKLHMEAMKVKVEMLWVLHYGKIEAAKRRESLLEMQQIIAKNQTKVVGREDYLDLLKNNPEKYQRFLEALPMDKCRVLEAVVEPLRNPTTYTQATSILNKVASYAVTPLSIAWRSMASSSMQHLIEKAGTVIATHDSQCKAMVQQFAEEELRLCTNELTKIEQNILLLSSDASEKEILMDAPLEDIELLMEKIENDTIEIEAALELEKEVVTVQQELSTKKPIHQKTEYSKIEFIEHLQKKIDDITDNFRFKTEKIVKYEARLNAIKSDLIAQIMQKYGANGGTAERKRILEEQSSIKRRLNEVKEKISKNLKDSPRIQTP